MNIFHNSTFSYSFISSKNTHGFTLVEILVVIAIIGLLASITFTQYGYAQKKGRDARRIEDITQIQRALELYYQNNNEYPHPAFGAEDGLGDWFNSTNNDAWNALGAELAPYISDIAKDPLNTGGFPFLVTNPGQYSYAYKTNEAGEGATDAAQVYDLITQFEDTNNPNKCDIKGWISNTEKDTTNPGYGQPWCAGSHGITPNLEGYSGYIYAAH